MKPERIATWWFHWNDLCWPDVDNLDKIKARAEGFAKASVSAAMLFGAHFRWDWLPVFPLLHDYIATVAEELHKYGIKLYDHHSVNLVHRYSTREEMRHVMLDSGPHLPFSPTWEAASTWQYKGKYLNDWRMIDVKTGKPLYLPQYTAEGFCHRNPEFREAYLDYAKYLISETGIDGLSADDPMYYAHLNACGCAHCRAELRRRTGMDLPPVEDRSFWYNWDNPAWLAWLNLRPEATGDFCEALSRVLPEGFILTGCGGSSAHASAVLSGSDARQFLRGCNYVNMEMSGNTPPYKHDPKTNNTQVKDRLVNASHHQAAAREKGVRAFCTGFAHSTVNANHVWAVSKILGADAWIGTLKMRLGLPRHILDTIPCEEDIVGEAFGFEKVHPELFAGESIGQLGVYFSYETRNHTLFGALKRGYYRDFAETLTVLFRKGINPHTIFCFPETAEKYPVILLSSVGRMTQEEKAAAQRYVTAGGKLIITGPTEMAGCVHHWRMSNVLEAEQDKLFSYVLPGESRCLAPEWHDKMEPEACVDPDIWSEPEKGVYYHRISSGVNTERVIQFCERIYAAPLPIKVLESKGYLCAMQETKSDIIVHFLAEDYDVDINHELDRIRTHRSRVNLLTKIEPIGVDGSIRIETDHVPEVYTPFGGTSAQVSVYGKEVLVQLSENCSYVILKFKK